MQVTREGNDFSATVKHDASDPTFSCCIGQNLEPANVLSVQSGAGLNLDADEVSGRIFEDNVHLLPRGRSPVIKLWLFLALRRLLSQFHHNKVF